MAWGILGLLMAVAGVRAVAQRRNVMGTLPLANPGRELVQAEPLSAGLEETLRERLRLIQRDLQVTPNHPLLLGRATEACLALALLNRESNSQQAHHWMDQARLYLRPLRERGVPAAYDLLPRTASLAALRWGNGGPIPVARFSTAPLPRDPGQPGLTPTATALQDGIVYPGRVSVSSGGPIGDTGMGPAPNAPGGFGGGGISSPWGPSGPSGGPTHPQPPAPAPPPTAELIARYQAALARNPRDPEATWKLAEALESSVPILRSRRGAAERPEHRARLKKALQLYLRAAELARTHAERGTFLFAAAQLWDRLGEDEQCYRLLKKAVTELPYSVPALRRYREACVRTGRMSESERATAQVRKWSTPEAVL